MSHQFESNLRERMSNNAEYLKKLEMMGNTKLMRLKGINSENEEVKVFYLESKIQDYEQKISELTLQFYKNKLDNFKHLNEIKTNYSNQSLLYLKNMIMFTLVFLFNGDFLTIPFFLFKSQFFFSIFIFWKNKSKGILQSLQLQEFVLIIYFLVFYGINMSGPQLNTITLMRFVYVLAFSTSIFFFVYDMFNMAKVKLILYFNNHNILVK